MLVVLALRWNQHCVYVILHLNQWNLMSISLFLLVYNLSLTTPLVVELSVWIGVGGCEYLISATCF